MAALMRAQRVMATASTSGRALQRCTAMPLGVSNFHGTSLSVRQASRRQRIVQVRVLDREPYACCTPRLVLHSNNMQKRNSESLICKLVILPHNLTCMAGMHHPRLARLNALSSPSATCKSCTFIYTSFLSLIVLSW